MLPACNNPLANEDIVIFRRDGHVNLTAGLVFFAELV
jgi:hypothetical protein